MSNNTKKTQKPMTNMVAINPVVKPLITEFVTLKQCVPTVKKHQYKGFDMFDML